MSGGDSEVWWNLYDRQEVCREFKSSTFSLLRYSRLCLLQLLALLSCCKEFCPSSTRLATQRLGFREFEPLALLPNRRRIEAQGLRHEYRHSSRSCRVCLPQVSNGS